MTHIVELYQHEFSPPMRGLAQCSHRVLSGELVSPAYAGIGPFGPLPERFRYCFPRLRGDWPERVSTKKMV